MKLFSKAALNEIASRMMTDDLCPICFPHDDRRRRTRVGEWDIKVDGIDVMLCVVIRCAGRAMHGPHTIELTRQLNNPRTKSRMTTLKGGQNG